MSKTTKQATTQEAPQLQLQDLVIAIQAIATASSRGAFRVEEFTQIGGAYDRIFKFLQDSGVFNQPTAPTTASNETAESV
ncbi:MAG TPA: hypothetical protein VFM18_19010 [Methanosarcina sp.]|nr:hypothetical protein [Methanosarcina sp.]